MPVVTSVVLDGEVPICAHREHCGREVPLELRLLVPELVPEVDGEPAEDPGLPAFIAAVRAVFSAIARTPNQGSDRVPTKYAFPRNASQSTGTSA